MTFLDNSKKQFGHLNISATHVELLNSVSSRENSKADFKSFDEVYKTSYSHGLEAIYAIEKVDLKTVRRINDIPKYTERAPIKMPVKASTRPAGQLEFDFGASFNERMDSFVLKEPVNILGLAPHAEKSLIDLRLLTIEDLLKADLKKLIYVKGMGQGHIDEIEYKLKSYVDGISLYACQTFSFKAWLRSLLGVFNRKKVFVALEPYQLAELFTLTPLESVEVRRLTLEKRREWQQEMQPFLLSKQKNVENDLRKMTQVFLKPWMDRRCGFAVGEELMERLKRICEQPLFVSPVIEFISTQYYQGHHPLNVFLLRGDEDMYFSNETVRHSYNRVLNETKSYFYKADLTYTLAELVSFLAREFARKWESYSQKFIEKTIRSSQQFRVRKGACGQLCVTLA